MATEQTSTSVITFLPFIVTIVVAISGWVFAYFHSRRLEGRKSKLALTNQKLRLLYGPLYARLLAGQRAWDAFSKGNWPAHGQGGYFTDGFTTTENEMATWRHWMRHVFHPMNEKLESIIIDHLDLVEGDEVPQAFLDALAHIAVYKSVLKKWDEGDFSEHVSILNFPAQELMSVVKPVYMELRAKQKALSSNK